MMNAGIFFSGIAQLCVLRSVGVLVGKGTCCEHVIFTDRRLWDDMCTFFDGCTGTVCAVGGEGREANATTALLLANARS